MAGCLEEATVLAFLGGTLEHTARSSVEAHIAGCSACADLVTWAAADQQHMTRLSGSAGRPFVGLLQPGARVGPYQILGALGRGGMGVVYAAYHPELDRRIALKVVQGFDGGSGERRARLLREARAIARLSHPNVVTVHDAGTFENRVFIAMELIEGRTIEQWLAARERTWQEALDVFLQAAHGLAAAHAAGVIHRDFKPQNAMIDRKGVVRVMDFGLARLDQEGSGEPRGLDDGDSAGGIETLTATGAFLGTPAYMSPEQFRCEMIDARSDQFSFCIALQDALRGSRPATALAGASTSTVDVSIAWRSNVPGWLRGILERGASADREQRYASMHEVIAALERGRTRLRRRVSAVAAAIGVLVAIGGAWRIAHANRVACDLPTERIAAVWNPDDEGNSRRQSIHRQFSASGRTTAETNWARVSKVLDDYMRAWSAMYMQTCEATHLRGEQSTEVLDLRMSCLQDDLDQVRALTDTMMTADSTAVSQAVEAALDLTPVSRCANVSLLKSAVPLPREERTLREVLRLRSAIKEVETLRELGSMRSARARAEELRPQVEATHFKPLLAELLQEIGMIEADALDGDGVRTLEEAVFVAVSAHDDLTAAKAETGLIYMYGLHLGQLQDAERWYRLATATLDRLGTGHERIRAWALNNYGGALCHAGRFTAAKPLIEQAVAFKEASVGADHPDSAISLIGLAYVLAYLDDLQPATVAADRAVAILERWADPAGALFSHAWSAKAEVLRLRGKNAEAKPLFQRAIDAVQSDLGAGHPAVRDAFSGLGQIALAEGHPEIAIPLLEKALGSEERTERGSVFSARARFALAQTLWKAGPDRRRSLRHASTAREIFERTHQTASVREVDSWLAHHHLASR